MIPVRDVKRAAGATCLIIVAVLVLALVLPDPAKVHLSDALLKPFEAGSRGVTFLGTDQLGRDQLSRLFWGAVVSIGIAISSTLIAAIVGSVLGMIAGRWSGPVDVILSRLADAQLAVPAVLLGLILVTLLGPSFSTTIVVIAAAGWVAYARVVRTEVMRLKSSDFVALARVAGVPEAKLLLRHVLPNVLPSIIVVMTVDIGKAVIWESSLSFLGLGVQAPRVSWGIMLAEGREYLQSAPLLVLAPALALSLTVYAFSILGARVQRAIDPHVTNRRS